MAFKIGTAGIPHSSKKKSIISGIERIKELGLSAMEVEFVYGVKISEEKAMEIRSFADSLGIKLSVHAPYYINLNAQTEEKEKKSIEMLLETVRISKSMGAQTVVFHPGYYHGDKKKAFKKIKKNLALVISTLKAELISPEILHPETMGKTSQFGELEEIIQLIQDTGLETNLCVDFAHIHAREGKYNSYDEFYKIIRKIKTRLGKDFIKRIHIHISGIEYGKGGEKYHLNLDDSDFRYDEWAAVLKNCEVEGTIIIESPNLEEDALKIKGLLLE